MQGTIQESGDAIPRLAGPHQTISWTFHPLILNTLVCHRAHEVQKLNSSLLFPWGYSILLYWITTTGSQLMRESSGWAVLEGGWLANPSWVQGEGEHGPFAHTARRITWLFECTPTIF